MSTRDNAMERLIAKDEIRDLALVWARAADRRDVDLLRSCYTDDGVDTHGSMFTGTADEFAEFMRSVLATTGYTAHVVANHLISLESDAEAFGEVYALAYHVLPAESGAGSREVLMSVRYLDHYRKVEGRWLFASRNVCFDYQTDRPLDDAFRGGPAPGEDLSYRQLKGTVFATAEQAGTKRADPSAQ